MTIRRITLCIHALHGGGAERLMADLATRWSQDYQLTLITWAKADSDLYRVPPSINRRGLDLQTPSSHWLHGLWANLKRVRALRAQLKDSQPDLILSFADQMNIVTLQAAQGLGVPTWISEHSNPERQRLSPLWERWRARTYPHCSGCTVLTQGIADYMSRWIPRQRLRVIPPAIHPIRPAHTANPNMANPNTASTANPSTGAAQPAPTNVNAALSPFRTLLYVGRLSAEKNLEILLKAWRQVAARLPQWQLLLVGDGPQANTLRRAAADLPRVEFTGWCPNPALHYAQADLFVLTSRYEGFPVALLEAMNHGVPALASDCSSAFQDVNRQTAVVTLFPNGDQAALESNLLRLAQDHRERLRLSGLARDAAANYHWQRIGPLWDALLSPLTPP